MAEKAEEILHIYTLTDGIIGPDVEKAGRVVDGGKISLQDGARLHIDSEGQSCHFGE